MIRPGHTCSCIISREIRHGHIGSCLIKSDIRHDHVCSCLIMSKCIQLSRPHHVCSYLVMSEQTCLCLTWDISAIPYIYIYFDIIINRLYKIIKAIWFQWSSEYSLQNIFSQYSRKILLLNTVRKNSLKVGALTSYFNYFSFIQEIKHFKVKCIKKVNKTYVIANIY